ncbi:hypothetical protein SARC_13387 [Sphaeroforma arctica JP610]|uniref:Peptidase M12B propeptide domain-containing protein n=1 Tax=Sphaeroforma arctica JP610 TaxID=667725 RepID=A0A0L0FBC4_9EUKA|nr:hypothetical protein SARC_13387 [Sphaeroforma arctica JP610]KNC74055.1 hypothetical protein SARC_13387 [Sphaeroforma arctica JP610]|eukprot:XP_014147957.1 hypothetical protein SARC_13387 [Sphaeroforma arctica JP610]
MFSLAPTLVLFGATFLGEVLALDFPINLQIPEDGVLGDTFGDSNIETLLDPYTELDFTPTEELAHLQYTDNFTVELRRRVQLALELPFKEVDFETHYDENGEVEYYPVYQFDNGTTVTVKSDYLLLENGHLVHQDDVGGYYKENGENVGQGDDPALLEGRTFVHEERFIWNQALEAGRVSACGCTGLQVMLKEECVPSLEHAIENSVAGDVIILSNNNTISKPVYFGHDLALVGETCDDYGKPTLYVNFHDKYKAGLMLTK